jgi:hypothetical protein
MADVRLMMEHAKRNAVRLLVQKHAMKKEIIVSGYIMRSVEQQLVVRVRMMRVLNAH